MTATALRHVMQGFEDRHQVVPAGSAEVGGVGDGEPHSISHASLLDAPASGADGIVVEIEAVHSDVSVCHGLWRCSTTGAARHVENLSSNRPDSGEDGNFWALNHWPQIKITETARLANTK
jgi:hypothetical protein